MAIWRIVSERIFVGKTDCAAVLAALGGDQSTGAVKHVYREMAHADEISTPCTDVHAIAAECRSDRCGGGGIHCATQQQPAV